MQKGGYNYMEDSLDVLRHLAQRMDEQVCTLFFNSGLSTPTPNTPYYYYYHRTVS